MNTVFHDRPSVPDAFSGVNWPDGEFLVAKRLKDEGERGKCVVLKYVYRSDSKINIMR
jgi:hypothetical protein